MDARAQIKTAKATISLALTQAAMIESTFGVGHTFNWSEEHLKALAITQPEQADQARRVLSQLAKAQRALAVGIYMLGIETYNRQESEGFTPIPEPLYTRSGGLASIMSNPLAVFGSLTGEFYTLHVKQE